jgi:hypothetical protein
MMMRIIVAPSRGRALKRRKQAPAFLNHGTTILQQDTGSFTIY